MARVSKEDKFSGHLSDKIEVEGLEVTIVDPGENEKLHIKNTLDEVTKADIGLGNVPNLDTTDAVADAHTHTNKEELDLVSDGEHDGRTDNPHDVTKTQVGLGNVTNDAQLKDSQLITTIGTPGLDTNVPTERAVRTNVEIVRSFFNVKEYGALGDGSTNDTIAIQNAIDAAYSAGGGIVYFPVGRYYTTGVLTLKREVVLKGAIPGPIESNESPASNVRASTLLITNNTNPFITTSDFGCGIEDLLFWYPNQKTYSDTTPDTYPITIKTATNSAGFKLRRCTFGNSFDAIQINVGRVWLEDLLIGAFRMGIEIDNAQDIVYMNNIWQGPLWDTMTAHGSNQTIDTWVRNNSWAYWIRRCDGFMANNIFAFDKFGGIFLDDSANTNLSPRSGYGTLSNIYIDLVTYGIYAKSSSIWGWPYTIKNFFVSPKPGSGAQVAIYLLVGGTNAPKILVDGGSIVGTWAYKYLCQAGTGHYDNIFGLDL